MIRRTPLLAALAACACILAVPSAALAVTGSANHPCYTHVPTKGSEPIVVSLTGGAPGGNLMVVASVPGRGWGSAGGTEGVYDGAGNATVQIPDVSTSRTIGPVRGQKIALSVREFTDAGTVDTPLGTVLVTNLAIDVSSKPADPRRPRRVAVSGTRYAGKRLYGFVVRGGHVLRRVALGRADGCGYASHTAVVAPRNYRTGNYRLYVNAGRSLHKGQALEYRFRIYRRYF